MANNKMFLYVVLSLTFLFISLNGCAETNSTIGKALESLDYMHINESKQTKRAHNISLINELKLINQIMEAQKFYKNLGQKMIIIVSPFLLLLGGIGNPLCIIVLIRKRQTNPTILYLCLLAAFDFLVLYTGLLRQVKIQFFYLKIILVYTLSHCFCTKYL